VEGVEPAASLWEGLTDNYVRVFAPSPEPLENVLVATRIVGEHPDGLAGSVAA
jgi:hypothetical protein